MRLLLLGLVGLLALAAVPAAQATSVWACANNTVCAGAGVVYNRGASYADVCLFPVAGCTFVPAATAPGLPVPPATCQSVNNPPVAVAVCAGG